VSGWIAGGVENAELLIAQQPGPDQESQPFRCFEGEAAASAHDDVDSEVRVAPVRELGLRHVERHWFDPHTLDDIAQGFADMHAGRNLRGVVIF
jgi:hypothetical protein